MPKARKGPQLARGAARPSGRGTPKPLARAANADAAATEKIDFFLRCAHEQDVTQQRHAPEIHDNRLTAIPRRAGAAFQTASQRDLNRWFREFTAAKFRFFINIMTRAADPDLVAAMIGVSKRSNAWKTLRKAWEAQADRERLAYLGRLFQLPSAVVHRQWYNNLSDFLEWSEICWHQVKERKGQSVQGFPEWYRTLLEEISTAAPNLEARYLLDWSHAGVVHGVREKQKDVANALVNPVVDDDRLSLLASFFLPWEVAQGIAPAPEPVLEFAYALSARFMTLLESGILAEERYLHEFCVAVRDTFNCGVADYLEVLGDGGALKLQASSVDVGVEDLREELKGEDTYQAGQGISGSILVQPELGTQLGTNDLSADPRISQWHEDAFEKVYGSTQNFWIFPVFGGADHIGAFRVINRRSQEAAELSGWPYHERLQLSYIAQWFGFSWHLLRAALRRARAEGLDVGSASAADLAGQLQPELPGDFLSQVIHHVRTVVHMRIEDRRIGCCILIVDENEAEMLEGLRKHPGMASVGIKNLADAATHYPSVHPTGGMFVFLHDGSFVAVYETAWEGATGVEALAGVTRELTSSSAFLLERRSDVVRIFRNGSLFAEDYLSHASGTWRSRYYDQHLANLRAECEGAAARKLVLRTVLERVYQHGWELSYRRIGALLVIVDKLPSGVERQRGVGVDLEERLLALSPMEFYDLASMDGAVIIKPRGIVKGAGWIMHVDSPKVSEPLQRFLATQRKGGRHTTAAQLTCAMPDAVVIAVSQNRGISIMMNGKGIALDV